MRDSAFLDNKRLLEPSFLENIGKYIPLEFDGIVIGEMKLLSVIANEGYTQAVFDIDLAEDVGPSFRHKNRAEVAFVEDRKCRCKC
jgi:hypothetical protein